MTISYSQKLVNIKKHENLQSKLALFTTSIDSFEFAIKKNRTFLSEAQHSKSSAHILKRYDRDNKIPQSLVRSIKKVIETLYTFVKSLEMFEVSDKLNQVYEPFENLQDCDLMTMDLEEQEVDSKTIKVSFIDFY